VLLLLQAQLWKKKAAPARQKRTYKTAAEVLEEAASGGAGGARVQAAQPILDLRGPQARLVTDLETLNTAAGAAYGVLGGVASALWCDSVSAAGVPACGVHQLCCVWPVTWRVYVPKCVMPLLLHCTCSQLLSPLSVSAAD
jgi:hypothetical protein